VKFFEHIAEYERLYRALLGSKGSPWFVRKMRASMAELVNEHERIPDTLVPDLVSAMLVEAVTWWLEHGRPYTPTEIATRCARLASALFKEVRAWQ
jgi:hypothetical protein